MRQESVQVPSPMDRAIMSGSSPHYHAGSSPLQRQQQHSPYSGHDAPSPHPHISISSADRNNSARNNTSNSRPPQQSSQHHLNTQHIRSSPSHAASTCQQRMIQKKKKKKERERERERERE